MSEADAPTAPAPAAPEAYALATVAVTAGRPQRRPDAPLNTPMTPASTYVAGGDLEYGRYANPGWSAFEDALGALEGGVAVSFSSGVAAIAAVLTLVPRGGAVVVPRHSYTGTLAALRARAEDGDLTVREVDVEDPAAVEAACSGAALLWIENPTNPALEVVDVAATAAAGHRAGALVVADNTFATPVLARPLTDGADLVLHSATKYLAGHSDALLGAVITSATTAERLRAHRTLVGSIPGVLETFLALRGLRTLHLRVERAGANAAELADRLRGHPRIERVRHPGWGAVISIDLRGGAPEADRVAAAVRLWVHATSLGGVESTLERRRRWPAEAPTIPDGLLRLSVGVEDVDDLWRDLARALDG